MLTRSPKNKPYSVDQASPAKSGVEGVKSIRKAPKSENGLPKPWPKLWLTMRQTYGQFLQHVAETELSTHVAAHRQGASKVGTSQYLPIVAAIGHSAADGVANCKGFKKQIFLLFVYVTVYICLYCFLIQSYSLLSILKAFCQKMSKKNGLSKKKKKKTPLRSQKLTNSERKMDRKWRHIHRATVTATVRSLRVLRPNESKGQRPVDLALLSWFQEHKNMQAHISSTMKYETRLSTRVRIQSIMSFFLLIQYRYMYHVTAVIFYNFDQ